MSRRLRTFATSLAATAALACAGGTSAAAASTTGGTAVPDGGSPAFAASGGVAPDSQARPPEPPKPTLPTSPTSPTAGSNATGTADVPAAYLRLYRAAAREQGIDWRVLAAIGKNESDHGRSSARGVASGVNFARCCAGPMQMCTVRSCGRVWQHYAVDANGNGKASVYEPADAIYAAAALVHDLRLSVGSRTDLLLASYNAGPAYAARHHRVPPFAETRAYVAAGLRYIAQLG